MISEIQTSSTEKGYADVAFTVQAIGQGAKEIRIHVLGEWRVVYVAKLRDAVYVLHAFQRKTRKTSPRDIELARRRYKEIGGSL